MGHRVVVAALLVLRGRGRVCRRPASAQQTISVQLGGFLPKGENSRVEGDVLVINRQYLLFDFGDFNGFLVGGEWSFALGRIPRGGRRLRLLPVDRARGLPRVGQRGRRPRSSRTSSCASCRSTAVVQVLPLGAKRAFQPYVGGGLAVYFWRYSETGEFLGTDDSVFQRHVRSRAARRSAQSRSSASAGACRSRRSSASKAATSGARATSLRRLPGRQDRPRRLQHPRDVRVPVLAK